MLSQSVLDESYRIVRSHYDALGSMENANVDVIARSKEFLEQIRADLTQKLAGVVRKQVKPKPPARLKDKLREGELK